MIILNDRQPNRKLSDRWRKEFGMSDHERRAEVINQANGLCMNSSTLDELMADAVPTGR